MVQSIIEDAFIIPISTNKSNSLVTGTRALAGIIAPAMTTDTSIGVEATASGPNVADADASWVPVTVDGTALAFTVATGAATADALSALLHFKRIRLACTTNQAAARTIYPQLVNI